MKKKNILLCILILLVALVLILLYFYYDFKNKEKENNPINITLENDFELDIIKTINAEALGNYILSPLSIEYALNLVKEGSSGNTRVELDKVLGTKELKNLKSVGNIFGIANALFIKDIYKKDISADYMKTLKNNYYSEFIYDEFKTPKAINDWVYNNTNKMIPNLLNSIDSDFVLGLANAISIDVKWRSQFECINTTPQDFTKSNNEVIKVSMMKETSQNLKYLKTDKEIGIIKPYEKYDLKTGKVTSSTNKDEYIELEFIALMPNSNIKEYVNNLNKDSLKNILDKFITPTKEEVALSLPKFAYEYNTKDLIGSLQKLGIKDAFDPTASDFSKMVNEDSTLDLFISQGIHKAIIELSESGTKAAAVTFFGFKNTSLPEEKDKVNIEFNKPFVYIIREKDSDSIMFFGIVEAPNIYDSSVKTCTE